MENASKVTYLLDTHVLVWTLIDPDRLPKRYLDIIQHMESQKLSVGISLISLWESSLLARANRIQLSCSLRQWLERIERSAFFEVIPLDSRVILESLELGKNFPKDPADRFIVGTARIHNLKLLTLDEKIKKSGEVIVA